MIFLLLVFITISIHALEPISCRGIQMIPPSMILNMFPMLRTPSFYAFAAFLFGGTILININATVLGKDGIRYTIPPLLQGTIATVALILILFMMIFEKNNIRSLAMMFLFCVFIAMGMHAIESHIFDLLTALCIAWATAMMTTLLFTIPITFRSMITLPKRWMMQKIALLLRPNIAWIENKGIMYGPISAHERIQHAAHIADQNIPIGIPNIFDRGRKRKSSFPLIGIFLKDQHIIMQYCRIKEEHMVEILDDTPILLLPKR